MSDTGTCNLNTCVRTTNAFVDRKVQIYFAKFHTGLHFAPNVSQPTTKMASNLSTFWLENVGTLPIEVLGKWSRNMRRYGKLSRYF